MDNQNETNSDSAIVVEILKKLEPYFEDLEKRLAALEESLKEKTPTKKSK